MSTEFTRAKRSDSQKARRCMCPVCGESVSTAFNNWQKHWGRHMEQAKIFIDLMEDKAGKIKPVIVETPDNPDDYIQVKLLKLNQ